MTDGLFRAAVQWIVLAAYGYQLAVWPLLFWLTTLLTAWTGAQWPAPVIVPWEQLVAGTATLVSIGGVEAVKAKLAAGDGRARQG